MVKLNKIKFLKNNIKKLKNILISYIYLIWSYKNEKIKINFKKEITFRLVESLYIKKQLDYIINTIISQVDKSHSNNLFNKKRITNLKKKLNTLLI